MHPFHDYIAKQLGSWLKERRVVVWYDERGAFRAFIEELRGGPGPSSKPQPITVMGNKASLVEYMGSLFELRAEVEHLVRGDEPAALVIYLPGLSHDAKGSVLMELEKAGRTWKPELKQLGRNVLLQKYTLGAVDALLPFERKVSYQDLAQLAADNSGAEPPSILKGIYHGVGGSDGLLTAWLVSDARDAELHYKEAIPELQRLVKARLGLELSLDATLSKLRAVVWRYLLAGEFRLDLSCEAPSSLEHIAKPSSSEGEKVVRSLVRALRAEHAEVYEGMADAVEEELGLRHMTLPAGALGTIDTFRFEEGVLLRHAGTLISEGNFHEALDLVVAREESFWLDRDIRRKAQWEAIRRMAELGSASRSVRAELSAGVRDSGAWLEAYVSPHGWYRLDQAQRRLEAWVATLDEEPEELPLAVVRRAYEETCQGMAEGFTKALVRAGWAIPGALHQTQVWSEVVTAQPKPVAYFLVDAMRFEMGVELAQRLPKTSEVSVRAAVAAFPTITPVGMAALMPGAAGSFSVIEQRGKLGAWVDEVFLPDLAARKKFAAARVPRWVDLSLDELLSLPPSKLGKKVEGAQVVLVRSQEIDHAGETGFSFQARQVMDTVIDNLARALRKLASAGIEQAVVSADHGHLFFAHERDESMRIDTPGGDTVELHRRCWMGRGGSTPRGCERVSASALGYASDLDVVFPPSVAVFKTGGDLAFHHGGPSLQELVVPVLSVRTRGKEMPAAPVGQLAAVGIPELVTNRIFSTTFTLGEKQLKLGATSRAVRPMLMSAGRQVGAVGMAVDAQLDRATGCVTLLPNKPATIAFLLSDERVESVRLVVQDPATDAELYRSPADIPVRLGV